MYDIISKMIEMEDAAKMFRALGDSTRLQLVQRLCCCPETVNGPTASEVCCQVTGAEKITSTVSHHLKELRESGLIRMERQGKCMCCSLDRSTVQELVGFLNGIIEGDKHECC